MLPRVTRGLPSEQGGLGVGFAACAGALGASTLNHGRRPLCYSDRNPIAIRAPHTLVQRHRQPILDRSTYPHVLSPEAPARYVPCNTVVDSPVTTVLSSVLQGLPRPSSGDDTPGYPRGRVALVCEVAPRLCTPSPVPATRPCDGRPLGRDARPPPPRYPPF